MFDSGSGQKHQVVGLPDTGTSVNESACPFDFESPQKVWHRGLKLRDDYPYPADYMTFYASENIAWADRRLKSTDAAYIPIKDEPFSMNFVDALFFARSNGCRAIRISYGQKYEEYPL